MSRVGRTWDQSRSDQDDCSNRCDRQSTLVNCEGAVQPVRKPMTSTKIQSYGLGDKSG